MDPEERQKQREARRRNRDPDEVATDEGNEDSNKSDGQDRDEQELSAQRDSEDDARRELEQRRKRGEEEREREVKEERQKKDEESKRQREIQEKEEAKKKKKPDKKRKGLGGLSPEKKRLLKHLIMQKAAEEMKAEMKKRQEEKENHLKKVVPTLNTDIDSKEKMTEIVKTLFEKMCILEGEKYDWELQLRKIDFEINELTLKVNNVKGKFVKPVLKRISKSEGMWSKLEKTKDQKSQIGFRDQLKSTGQNKFALDEKDESHTQKNTDWRDHLKPKESDTIEEGAEVQIVES